MSTLAASYEDLLLEAFNTICCSQMTVRGCALYIYWNPKTKNVFSMRSMPSLHLPNDKRNAKWNVLLWTKDQSFLTDCSYRTARRRAFGYIAQLPTLPNKTGLQRGQTRQSHIKPVPSYSTQTSHLVSVLKPSKPQSTLTIVQSPRLKTVESKHLSKAGMGGSQLLITYGCLVAQSNIL